MNLEEAKDKIAEHGFNFNISPTELLVKLANYVAKNYEINVKIGGESNPAEIGTSLNLLLSNIGGASEDLLNKAKSQQSYSDSGFLDESIGFFANHLDSSLLFALEKHENPELPLNEVVAFEDLENLEDDQILPSVIEKIKNASSNTSWLFTHDLSEKEWKSVNRHLKEINIDNCRRLLMLLLRLDVTVMSFFGSPRLENLEEKIREVHNEGKANLVIPKCAGICDLLVAEPNLLNIEKVKGNARARIKQYTLEEAPPTRGASHRLQISSGAADPSSASRGRNAYRGRGGGGRGHRGHGRGNFRQHYSKRENEGLQSQVCDEIERQLAASEGPKRKRNKN
uniref:Uncharacterized protein n=1 Tax=Panagrolaimus superbus TaxID=310955 RepID=A0A914Y9D7_9BILA